ncbi:MAG TPA: amino acid synthesis family protein [Chloroflexota bacterium]|nr:amino acid synthesis family protein [Chloroflexota bacterium]
MDIRKTVTLIEDTLIEGGKTLPQPARRVALVAVIRNPLVGRDDENLDDLVNDGEDLGRFLAQRALDHLDRGRLASIGKGVIVGRDGEPEHGQALLHPKFASAVRETLDFGSTQIQSVKKIGPPSSPIEITLHRIGGGNGGNDAGSFELRVPGSPRDDEILVALVVGSAHNA